MDSTKLLTEKLSLSRELASLRPELEHLKSQALAHQSILAEKLSLQRQLSTIQVELENEKRSTQRALSREENKQGRDAELEAQIDSLQADLSRERRERQKAEREAQKVSTEFDGKKTVLESRLDAFRNKLRMTKEQLKETQEELQNARANIRTQTATNTGMEATIEATRNPRKRSLAQFDTDAAIGTPGILPAAKKSKRGSTLPGDKSTFSITPFLNKTISVALESPLLEQSTAETEQGVEGNNDQAESVPTLVVSPSAQAAKKSVKKESKKNAAPKKPAVPAAAKVASSDNTSVASRRPKITPALEQVQEEDNDESLPPANQESMPSDEPIVKSKIKIVDMKDRASEEPTFIKKKRKLLGGGPAKTLFDDDDGELVKGGDRGLFGGAKGFGSFGRPLGNPKLGGRLGSSVSGFGAFSPLKKDRKVLKEACVA